MSQQESAMKNQTLLSSVSRHRSPEERDAMVYSNIQKQKDLHNKKISKTAKDFQNTRVTSCGGILMKNGKAVALGFGGQSPKPIDIAAKRSSETTSFAQ